MHKISRERCFNHAHREAAALCLECNHYFCRECVTEHDDRVLCSSCILKSIESHKTKKDRFHLIFRTIYFFASVLFLWFCFYTFGQILLKIPVAFHEGTFWKDLMFWN